jgi:uncharacterized membrane protein YczE
MKFQAISKFRICITNLVPYAKSVPATPWTGKHRWDFGFTRFAILIVGLFIFGLGDALLIASELGNAPWSVLAQGLALQSGLSIGVSTFLISGLVLTLWLPLRERPGLGTIMNIIVIALAIDIGLAAFPTQGNLLFRFGYVFLGIALIGIGSALYITCGLGPGPRDGWMTALHARTGAPVARVRLGIEMAVLVFGWALGGRVGVATALFATLIGQSVAISFGVVARATSR